MRRRITFLELLAPWPFSLFINAHKLSGPDQTSLYVVSKSPKAVSAPISSFTNIFSTIIPYGSKSVAKNKNYPPITTVTIRLMSLGNSHSRHLRCRSVDRSSVSSIRGTSRASSCSRIELQSFYRARRTTCTRIRTYLLLS